MTALIGTSGWTYPQWAGTFYPDGLAQNKRLDYYATRFRTAELNGSFYRWPPERSFESWRDRLPRGFELAVKASRGLTHASRLRNPERWRERIARAAELLADRRGPLLLQLHPALTRDDERLDHALSTMPSPCRIAVEFRHDSWLHEQVFAVLEKHQAAYVVMSGAGLPCVLRATAAFVYVRWHGPSHEHLYAGSYSEADLQWWAERIREWERSGHAVYGYFNNDEHGYAAHNGLRLREILGQ